MRLGATGKFPQGKIHSSDEGELRMMVGEFEDQVVLDFGTPVKWLSFPVDQAETFANAILAKVNVMRQKRGGLT